MVVLKTFRVKLLVRDVPRGKRWEERIGVALRWLAVARSWIPVLRFVVGKIVPRTPSSSRFTPRMRGMRFVMFVVLLRSMKVDRRYVPSTTG